MTASKGTVISSHLFHLCCHGYEVIMNTNILLHLVFGFSFSFWLNIKMNIIQFFPLQVMSYHDNSNVRSLIFFFIFCSEKRCKVLSIHFGGIISFARPFQYFIRMNFPKHFLFYHKNEKNVSKDLFYNFWSINLCIRILFLWVVIIDTVLHKDFNIHL